MRRCSGFTLMEVMVSFTVLLTTGTLMFHFLYPGKAERTPWINDYGTELSKIALLSMPALKDTTIQHTDTNGNQWEVLCSAKNEGDETCAAATAIRNGTDTTRTIHLCRFGEEP